MSNTIPLVEPKETGVVEYEEIRAKLNEVKEECNFIPDVSSAEGYEKSKRVSLDVGKILSTLEKKRVAAKADALAYGRLVDSEAANIREALTELQLPHKQAYRELDQAKKDREAKRKVRLEAKIAEISTLPVKLCSASSAEISAALETLENEDCETFYEYTMEALKARNAAREALEAMFTAKLQSEKDAAELASLQEAQAVRDAADLKAHAIAEAKAKVEREEADRLKAIAAKAEEERIAAERAHAEAREAIIAAEEKAKQEVADAKMAAKQAIANAKRIAEEKEESRLQAEKVIDDARAARQKDDEHRSVVNADAIQGLRKLPIGISYMEARAVIEAIAAGQIPAVTINY